METHRPSFTRRPSSVQIAQTGKENTPDVVPQLKKLPTNQFIDSIIGQGDDSTSNSIKAPQSITSEKRRESTRRESHWLPGGSSKTPSRQSSARLGRSRQGSLSNQAVDYDDTETTLDQEEQRYIYDETGQRTYENACRKYNAVMSRSFYRKLPNAAAINLSHYGTGPRGAKAIAIPMVNNTKVTTLDLSNNDLGYEGIGHVAKMMSENTSVTELNLSENGLRTNGAKQVAMMLQTNHNLKTLHLSGNNFADSDAKIIADAVEEHPMLQYLDLSHNNFGEVGGTALKKMISENGILHEVDLSWNNIRMKGAVDLAKAIKENIGLKVFRVAWNGFGDQGAIEMGQALKANGTLQELDLTCNRISHTGFAGLVRYIRDNDDLKTLKVGRNPITEDAAVAVMEMFTKIDDLALQTLDLGEITLGPGFKEKLKEVQEKHPQFSCPHGYTDSYGKRKLKKYNVVEEAIGLMREYLEANNMNIAELFSQIDTDGSMSVSYDEFREGLRAAKIPLTNEQIEQLIKALDEDGDGEIDFSELILGAEALENGQ